MNGQPFRLRLLQAFAPRRQDPEAQLPHLLQQGVPAGILQEIPTSHQWQASLDDNGLDGVHLLHGALQGYSAFHFRFHFRFPFRLHFRFHFHLSSASISGHLRAGPPHPGGPVLPGPAA